MRRPRADRARSHRGSELIALTAAASCHRCDWTATGGWAEVDRQAERHAKNHPTVVMVTIRPSKDHPVKPDKQ
jgi:hypothetical protein